MNKLIRLYNQNRFVFWVIIIIIALIFIVIQTLNSIVKQDSENKKSEMLQNALNQANMVQNQTIQNKVQADKSISTGEKVVNAKSNEELIKEFVKCCNEGKLEIAYNMLTDECKETLYPSLERFKKGYVDRIFYITRLYGLENWYSTSKYDTYYVKYTENILASRKNQLRRQLGRLYNNIKKTEMKKN